MLQSWNLDRFKENREDIQERGRIYRREGGYTGERGDQQEIGQIYRREGGYAGEGGYTGER